MFQLEVETLRYAIPQTWVDPQYVDFQAYAQSKAVPGGMYPLKAGASAGKNVSEVFYETKPATLPKEVEVLDVKVDKLFQFITGILPPIFGGTSAGGSKTLGEVEQDRNQALQRLSTIWYIINMMYSECMNKSVKAYMDELLEDEHLVEAKGDGFINTWIRTTGVTGKLGKVVPEFGEQFPISWAQKRAVLMELIGLNNEMINSRALQQERDTLLAERARLLVSVNASRDMARENAELRALLQLQARPGQRLVQAALLYQGHDWFDQRITLDRGGEAGLRAGLPVVDVGGLLGQLSRVDPGSSELTLVSSPEQMTPVFIQRTGQRGLVAGSGRNQLELRFMPSHTDIRVGDRLLTSGIDRVYPAGIPVAWVSRVSRSQSSPYLRVECLPLAGLDRSRVVLVLAAEPAAIRPTPSPISVPQQVLVTQSPACGSNRERGFVMWSGGDRRGHEWTLEEAANRRPTSPRPRRSPSRKLSFAQANSARPSGGLTYPRWAGRESPVARGPPTCMFLRMLADGWQSAGAHRLVWGGLDEGGAVAPAGLHFVRAEVAGRRMSLTLVRIR